MKVTIDYYTLNESRQMGDGTIIPQGQELIMIKKEDDLIQFEATEVGSTIFFWASDDEVTFDRTKEEYWSEEKINQRNRHINGEFL